MSSAYDSLRNNAVRYSQLPLSFFICEGSDAAQYLHGQTTSDVKSLKIGQIQPSALLDSKARTLALMHIARLEENVFLVISWQACAETLSEHLNKYIIMDEVEISPQALEVEFISGPGASDILQKTGLPLVAHDEITSFEDGSWLTHFNICGESDFLLLQKSKNLPKDLQDLPQLSEEDLQTARIEAGVPWYGIDLGQKTLFPETGLQVERVSFTKGCFLGQEIVARVKYRGSVNRLLYALHLSDCSEDPTSEEIFIRGKKAGKITSLCRSPHLGGDWLALAYLGKDVRQPESRHNVTFANGFSAKARVMSLPVYRRLSAVEEAERLFYEGTSLFAQAEMGDDLQVENCFRQAIRLNPSYADAYEALGVLLSRHERYDEAIELMKRLAEIDPEEVMAYTNLSVFYMKKGMISEAEEEKTRATVATFKKAAKERKVRLEEETIRKQQQQEMERRAAMFRQVLEIDPDDLVANFGLAKYSLEQQDYSAACDFSQRCIAQKKDYPSAYLIYGKALLKLKKVDEAISFFKLGIHYAKEKGEFLPMREMEQVLSQIIT